MTAEPPTKAQYYRWLAGELTRLPRPHHCLVLERMFPGWTARELLTRDGQGHTRPTNSRLIDHHRYPPSIEPASLIGLWVTAYMFDNAHHADLSTITTTNTVVTAQNYPPTPRTEGCAAGFHNDITLALFGRHLLGQWRNTSDSYYYGSIHLAVLPGETILDGYYTAVLTDTQVAAGRWRWIRVDPQSTNGIDLNTVTLADPRRIYNLVTTHTQHGAPIPLTQLEDD